MTCDFPDLGSASDWLRQISHAARQSESLPRIVDLGSHASSVWNFCASLSGVAFYRETSGGVAKLLFSSIRRTFSKTNYLGRRMMGMGKTERDAPVFFLFPCPSRTYYFSTIVIFIKMPSRSLGGGQSSRTTYWNSK